MYILIWFSLIIGIVANNVSNWDIIKSNTSIMRFHLYFNNKPLIRDICSSIKVNNINRKISLCDDMMFFNLTIDSGTRGVNNKLGHYTETLIHYSSKQTKIIPSVDFVIQNYDLPNTMLLMYLKFDSPITTNWVAPLYDSPIGYNMIEPFILNIPFDNDFQSSYASVPFGKSKGFSSYATAIYETSADTPSSGIILGCIEHDLWKTGIEYNNNKISSIIGLNSPIITRDLLPHGSVKIINTPILSLGFYNNWMDGMENYADFIESKHTFLKKNYNKSVSGWDSWGLIVDNKGSPTTNELIGASDTLLKLKTNHFGDIQYISRDAIYGLNDSATNYWINHVKHNKQEAGSYAIPFILWSTTQLTIDCEGNTCLIGDDNCWLINDIIIKDLNGNRVIPLSHPKVSVRDPTHPQTACYLENQVNTFKKQNISIIKLDFINYVAVEGYRYNMSAAPTGISAYNYALKMLYTLWGKNIIINYGITLPLPIAPGTYIRRHGCDQMFGGVEYSMNQYAGGWWLNKFYILNPDLVTFQGDFWFSPKYKKVTEIFSMDSISRVAKAVVYGGFFQNGDDLSNKTNINILRKFLGNTNINKMWEKSKLGTKGSHFRALKWKPSVELIPLPKTIIAPNIYFRSNVDDIDIVIFNYIPFKKLFSLNLNEVIYNRTNIRCINIWNNNNIPINNNIIDVYINKTSSVLIQCTYIN